MNKSLQASITLEDMLEALKHAEWIAIDPRGKVEVADTVAELIKQFLLEVEEISDSDICLNSIYWKDEIVER